MFSEHLKIDLMWLDRQLANMQPNYVARIQHQEEIDRKRGYFRA